MNKLAILLVALALVCSLSVQNVCAQYDSEGDNLLNSEVAAEEAEATDDLEERQYNGYGGGPANNIRPWVPPSSGPAGGVRPYPQPGPVRPVPLPGGVNPVRPVRPGRPLCRRDPYTGRVVCTRPSWGH